MDYGKLGWWAAYNDGSADYDETYKGLWQPSIQLEGICLELPIGFHSEKECIRFIQDDILGKELMEE